MNEEQLHLDTEICICAACCRDFKVGVDECRAYKMFCPTCRSPYLLDEEDYDCEEKETPEDLQ